MSDLKVGRIEQLTHTPGPWEHDGKFTVTIPTRNGVVSFRANPGDARLIAAAPELLAALKGLLRQPALERATYTTDIGLATAVDRAVAAIAKAEGR